MPDWFVMGSDKRLKSSLFSDVDADPREKPTGLNHVGFLLKAMGKRVRLRTGVLASRLSATSGERLDEVKIVEEVDNGIGVEIGGWGGGGECGDEVEVVKEVSNAVAVKVGGAAAVHRAGPDRSVHERAVGQAACVGGILSE